MRLWKRHQNSALKNKDEVLVTSQTDVGLYDRTEKTQYNKGKISLTTHNLYYSDDATGDRWRMPLENIDLADHAPIPEKGFLLRSDKIIIYLPFCEFIKVAFRKGGMEPFFFSLMRMLEQRHWESKQNAKPKTSSSSPCIHPPISDASSSLGVPQKDLALCSGSEEKNSSTLTPGLRQLGIAGVIEGSKESSRMAETFTDIDDVMRKTSSLVESIQRLKRNASSGGFGEGVDPSAIESIETTLGLDSMVRKSKLEVSTGETPFSHALATELHSWMAHDKNADFFARMNLISLAELFALYNKARSGHLISPNDLLEATRALIFAVPQPKYALHQLSSGEMALMHVDDSILLSQLTVALGPRYSGPHENAIMEACRIEEKRKESEGQQEHTNASQSKSSHASHRSSVVQEKYPIPRSSIFPRRDQLKSINEARAASLLHVSMHASRDILFHLEKKGFLCHADAGFGARIFYWNIFVF